ncbi:formate dehydrogenase accessory sulfurtransferase FdhD [Nonomuraea gerenzanensis]|uniref:Formate dehydrogenase chain D n=1 Tax=Nonomuraea gerenzanensis TaxID=93944 RepID=A0A1M4E427_9ACTN|nr:Formate dehydrogenase chain D [Nonomuraea gerenzanensis]
MSYDRLTHPLIRDNGVLRQASWEEALDRLLMVSGRTPFELVRKAVMGGVPVPAAVSAPSSPAVEPAEEQGLTLIGFLRGSSMNVHTGERRLRPTGVTPGAGNGSAGARTPG